MNSNFRQRHKNQAAVFLETCCQVKNLEQVRPLLGNAGTIADTWNRTGIKQNVSSWYLKYRKVKDTSNKEK